MLRQDKWKSNTIWLTLMLGLSILSSLPSAGQQVMQLPQDPDLSFDGKRLAFVWRGDIWLANSTGGVARRLTETANNSSPKFSPDGKRLAFVSRREMGSSQIFVMPVAGGKFQQLTYHTDGFGLLQWTPDGRQLLVSASRDYDWRRGNRMLLIDAEERSGEKLLFDSAASEGQLSPDGKQVLFTREGVAWWRKGYYGSQSSQLWKYDLTENSFQLLDDNAFGAKSPLWAPDGESFYFLGAKDGTFNLYQRSLKSDEIKPLTEFKDDGVVMPCLSGDGSTMVFRQLFDFYRMTLDGKPAQKIRLVCRADQTESPYQNLTLDSASEADFSADGLEVAMVAGGDLWVMDTVLREPKQITSTPEMESAPTFSPDGNTIFFVSDAGGQCDIWSATRSDSEKYWWLNESFQLKQLTKDGVVESDLKVSPAGDKIAYNRKGSGLWIMNVDGSQATQFLKSWDATDFDWSPDGKWLTWAVSNDDFNSDVFLGSVDGSQPPINLSRHPRNDGRPVWSPDGKMIAFTGQRDDGENDLHLVVLQRSLSERDSRDRKMEEALKKFENSKRGKAGKSDKDTDGKKGDGKKGDGKIPSEPETPAKPAEPSKTKPANQDPSQKQDPPATDPQAAQTKTAEDETSDESKTKTDDSDKKADKKLPEVRVDVEEIHSRIIRVSIPGSSESGMFWSPDSKFLAFNATIDSKPGVYKIEPPHTLSPKLMMGQMLSGARWIEEGKQILSVSGGVPQSSTESGQATRYTFSVLHSVHQPSRYQAGFDQAWRAMRDGFYDGKLNNRNWDAIRRKYQAAAKNAPNDSAFAVVVQMMLGELNGSHLGFSPGGGGGGRGRRRGGAGAGGGGGSPTWNESTAHFGLQFDWGHAGPGLLVKDVIYRSPAWQERSRVLPGEVVLAINGTEVDPEMDLTTVLNGRPDQEFILRVKAANATEREVKIKPISFGAAKSLLYAHWGKSNQALVDKLSNNSFGYVHIRGMNMSSFYEFERDLFAVASGKDGLVIDVRDNGGGSTADHLLTVLTQPRHALTIPREGGVGYPTDRMVYATWHKPIVVMCNQNSFSNAEIFSHAIKTLKRGRLVGVPTAGGVISTGAARIMDLGTLRMPFRGWYLLNDGEDMELNGAVPDFVIWPNPAEQAKGVDEQLLKAIEVLKEDVDAWKKRPQPKLRKASER